MSNKPRKKKPHRPKVAEHNHPVAPSVVSGPKATYIRRAVTRDTPEDALEQFVYQSAENLLEKVKIMDGFLELLPDSAEAYEVHLNFCVASLALMESLNILNGDIPIRIQQKYGVHNASSEVHQSPDEAGGSPGAAL